jgi:hypothetical protein
MLFTPDIIRHSANGGKNLFARLGGWGLIVFLTKVVGKS